LPRVRSVIVIGKLSPVGLALALVLSATLLCSPTAEAHDTTYSVALKGGVSVFMNAQSSALTHRLKPMVRLEGAFRIKPNFSVAVEFAAAATPEAGYRLLGGYLLGRLHLYQGDIFQFNFSAGGGLGTGARILSADLQAESDVAAWLQAGLQFRWAVITRRLDLGLDLISENISTLGLSAVVEVHF
jgi:hypothetical protein